jgi:hypothetical protein
LGVTKWGAESEAVMDCLSMPSVRRKKRQDHVFFYGGLAVLLIFLYGGAAFLQSVNSSVTRPFEAATNFAVAAVIGAFVGRKFGIGWGMVVGVTIAALALIASMVG